MPNTYLTRTPGSAGNNKIWTFSGWIKRSTTEAGGMDVFMGNSSSDSPNDNGSRISLVADQLRFQNDLNGVATEAEVKTNAVYRDLTAWYHIVVAVDTTQATASNRVKLYVNGEQITSLATSTYPAQNDITRMCDTQPMTIGRRNHFADAYFNGYMSDLQLIDGQQLDASYFGQTDSTNIWKPKGYTGSYGTTGFYLKMSNSGSLGADSSGNGNDFTKTGNGRQMTDTPSNIFCNLNKLLPVQTHSLTAASLTSTNSSGTHGGTNGTLNYPTSGKWYHEVRINAEDSSKGQGVGIGDQVYRTVTTWGNYGNFVGYMSDGTLSAQGDGGYTTYGTAHNVGDIIGVAYNADDQELTFYHNGSSQGVIVTSSIDGTIDFNNLCPIVFGRNMGQTFNFGQNGTFSGNVTAQGNADGNGYGDFYYSVPTGYLALCTKNLASVAAPTINDGSQYFNTVLYSGNNTAKSITGVGFQPDFIWDKNRSDVYNHYLNDSSRGVTKYLNTNNSGTETTITQGITSFDSDGFTLGTDNSHNANATNLVAWNWKANGGTTSSNTDGTITSTVQANTTSGFSIVLYTGNGGTGATVGHGLGTTPKVVIVKVRAGTTTSNGWRTYTEMTGNTKYLVLNATDVANTFGDWNNTSPTNSVFTVNSTSPQVVNESGTTYVAYCFAEIKGYSQFGSYTGNGSADGPFIYTGFKPTFIIFKRTDVANNWNMFDIKRDTYNQAGNLLYPNLTAEEQAAGVHSSGNDILSNGFKLRQTGAAINASGGTYIYMAFAENPLVTSGGLPVTAR